MDNKVNENVENKENNEKLKEFFDVIDNADYLSDDIVDNMDFYQLSSYIQTLNALDHLTPEDEDDGDE